jgi:hypothetical protein
MLGTSPGKLFRDRTHDAQVNILSQECRFFVNKSSLA